MIKNHRFGVLTNRGFVGPRTNSVTLDEATLYKSRQTARRMQRRFNGVPASVVTIEETRRLIKDNEKDNEHDTCKCVECITNLDQLKGRWIEKNGGSELMVTSSFVRDDGEICVTTGDRIETLKALICTHMIL